MEIAAKIATLKPERIRRGPKGAHKHLYSDLTCILLTHFTLASSRRVGVGYPPALQHLLHDQTPNTDIHLLILGMAVF
jgi:hypothetical protein